MNKTIISLGLILVLILGSVFLFRGKIFKSSETISNPGQTPSSRLVVSEEKEKDAQVDLTAESTKKSVVLKVSKISSDTVSLEYELMYETKDGLPRGVSTDPRKPLDVKGKEEITRQILLGTCSSGGKCVYDEGVKKISLVLKFNKTDGKSTTFSQDYDL